MRGRLISSLKGADERRWELAAGRRPGNLFMLLCYTAAARIYGWFSDGSVVGKVSWLFFVNGYYVFGLLIIRREDFIYLLYFEKFYYI